jgi:ATP-dependent exoDNAse (exonuclease V) alpha subunit
LPASITGYGKAITSRSSPSTAPTANPRVENGTRGQIIHIDKDGALTLTLDGSDRHLQLAREDVESLRLAYAQHVYRQQGATVEHAIVLTGGWQTSRESAYVQATRARHGTGWHLARDTPDHNIERGR